MLFPYKIIESKYSFRNEFRLTEGHQPTHALFFLKKGKFSIEIDGTKEMISSGDCCIIPSYVYHTRNIIEPIEFVYLQFCDNPACPYKIEIPIGKVIFLDKQRFISSINMLEKLLLNEDSLSSGHREHLLLDILFQLYSENHLNNTTKETPHSHDILVNRAIEYIEQNLGSKILIDEICRSIGTNSATLNFKFRRELNLSIGQYIISERIKKSQKLLIGTSYTVSEIAAMCGFQDVYYFSNTFKKLQGVSPARYRKIDH